MRNVVQRLTNTVTLCVTVLVCLGVGSPKGISVEPFLERARFEQARALPTKHVDLKSCSSVRGALVNHHALASDLLWKLFQRLALCRPDVQRLIILAPDHFFQGQTAITTGNIRYQRGKKYLQTDQSAVNQLVQAKVAAAHPKVFQKEHGIGALVPFILETFPKAKIVPIIIRPDVSQADARRLADRLNKQLDKNTLLIVSADMSHYLPERIALQKDRETLQAFEQLRAGFFWTAKDDHLDFGKGTWVALQALAPKDFELLDQAISTKYGGSAAYTTSYITGVWR